MSDLIAAIATGSIATAIGIVRVSGDGCFAACDRVFRPRNGVPFAQQTSHKMVFGEMLDDSGAVIDQGLAVRFGGGHSYTGEDTVELHLLCRDSFGLSYDFTACTYEIDQNGTMVEEVWPVTDYNVRVSWEK